MSRVLKGKTEPVFTILKSDWFSSPPGRKAVKWWIFAYLLSSIQWHIPVELFLIRKRIQNADSEKPKDKPSASKVAIDKAKEKILELEDADTIFIGGTGGDTKEIVQLSEKKLKSGGRIVIGVILIETLYSVLQVLEKLQFESVDITQVTISKSRKTSTGTMMLARNPVTIISATKI